ncbi:MAG TPA: hypothetical protein PKO06_17940, partial [Candidatus Ozemobacteraceae bacterium]|nr:hypothetical protein [Candidatus Ozemobacteraceae bacterium]
TPSTTMPPALTTVPATQATPAPTPVAAPLVTPVAPAATAQTPSPTGSTSGLSIERRFPNGGGYADPYKPVEVHFSGDLPADTVPEKVVRVTTLNPAGQQVAVDGRWLKVGARAIHFLPTRYQPGAVYHVRVSAPPAVTEEVFRFAVLPDVKMTVDDSGAELQIFLTWNELRDLYPAADGQVTRLEFAEISISSGGKPCWNLKLDDSLPPVGEVNDAIFQGEPFRFAVRVPKARLTTADGVFEVALDAAFAGRDKLLRFRKSTLKTIDSAIGSAKPEPLTASQMPQPPVASTPSAIAPVAQPAVPFTEPAAAKPGTENPAETASATKRPGTLAPLGPIPLDNTTEPDLAAAKPEPVTPPVTPVVATLKPVTPIADPGPQAIPVPVRDISLVEKDSTSHSWPKGMRWAADGALWVVDSQGRRVMRFSEDGALLGQFGVRGEKPTKAGGLRNPVDVVVSAAGVFVSDTSAHCVHLFHPDGRLIRAIGTWGTKRGQMDLPHGIDFNQEQLWIADRGNSQIMRFGSDGTFQGAFGAKSDLPGGLNNPISVCVTADGCWVLEGENGRVQKFDRTGRLKFHFLSGAKDPTYLAVDPWGYLWLADGEDHQVKRFDNRGKAIVSIEPRLGTRPWVPTSVAVRADGLIAVGDAENRLIRLFRLQKP